MVTQSEAAYKRRMTGEGISYWDRQRVRVECSECGEELAVGLLSVHQQTHHGKLYGKRRKWEITSPDGEPQTYRMVFPPVVGLKTCPVEECWGRVATQMAIRVHFLHQHVRDTVILMEKGNPPHSQCPWCDILVPWKALKRRHITTSQCAKGAESKR